MAPHSAKTFGMCWPDNYFEGSLSADAAGIVACLYTFSHLSFRHDSIADHFHALREFASEHAESGAILQAID